MPPQSLPKTSSVPPGLTFLPPPPATPYDPIAQRCGAIAGALVGLFLVVVQLQQVRELTQAQVRDELAMGVVELLQVNAANLQLASVLRRAAAGEPLTPDEQFQFSLRSNALLRYWENAHAQYRQGLYDEVEYSRQKDAWATAIKGSMSMVRYWCTVRQVYSLRCAAEIDGLLPAPGCPAESSEKGTDSGKGDRFIFPQEK